MNKMRVFIFALIVLLTACSPTRKDSTSEQKPAVASNDTVVSEQRGDVPIPKDKEYEQADSKPMKPIGYNDVDSVIEGNNRFAFELYNLMSKESDKNFVFSSYSIQTCFGMVNAGANGNTKAEIERVMHYQLQPRRIGHTFKVINQSLIADKNKGEIQIINGFWHQKDYPLLDTFKKSIRLYTDRSEPVNFKANAAAILSDINQWVANNTNQKILDLLPERSLNNTTRLVLVNAIYFRQPWKDKFRDWQTKPRKFTLSNGDTIMHNAMINDEGYLPYSENDKAHFVSMSFAAKEGSWKPEDEKFSMLFIVPKTGVQLKDVESFISAEVLRKQLNQMKRSSIVITVPKFKTKGLVTDQTLKNMGIVDAFKGGAADFSGIDGSKDLRISVFRHKAFVGIDETGTEAAAASAAGFVQESAMMIDKTLHIDRPFMFAIMHQSGSILFLGRITNPAIN